MNKLAIRYFPWCPGVPWKMKDDQVVYSMLSPAAWRVAMNKRTPVVVANGGLVESFFSLTFLEMLQFMYPGQKINWVGNEIFEPLIKINGIGQVYNKKITDAILDKFPTPIFMDKENNVYFNCLYNYVYSKSIFTNKLELKKTSITKQIINNTTQDWDNSYFPKFRNCNKIKEEVDKWAASQRIPLNKPYVCIFIDRAYSIHSKISTLGWNDKEIKSFAAMLKQRGITPILFTENNHKYYNTQLHCLPNKLELALYLIQNATAVLSEEIDYLIVAGMISDAILIGKKARRPFNLMKNVRCMRRWNDICISKQITPLQAFERIIGKSC